MGRKVRWQQQLGVVLEHVISARVLLLQDVCPGNAWTTQWPSVHCVNNIPLAKALPRQAGRPKLIIRLFSFGFMLSERHKTSFAEPVENCQKVRENAVLADCNCHISLEPTLL